MLAGTMANNHKLSSSLPPPSLLVMDAAGIVTGDNITEVTNEHYIHSRLRNILPSGPKEAASAYSGIMTEAGDNLRRMASVNAEARTKLVYTTEHGSKTAVHGSESGHVTKDNLLSPTKHDTSTISQTVESTHMCTLLTPGSITSPGKSCLASPKSTTPLKTIRSPNPQYFMKDSVLQVADVRKTQRKKFLNLSPPSFHLSGGSKPSGYIKRMAAVNAQAFVHAIMGYEYLTKNERIDGTTCEPVSDVLGKRTQRQPGNSNQNNSKKKKEGAGTSKKVPLLSELTQTVNTIPLTLLPSPSAVGHKVHLESLSSSNGSNDESPTIERRDGCHQEPESTTYNCLGLLYNSDTVHAKTAIYLTTEGYLPSILIPPIIPQKLREVNLGKASIKENSQRVRKRSRKGDNGWIVIGDPIKTMNIRRKGGGESVERKYFIGIKRKDEEMFVRDSIIVRSGHKRSDNPYIAKIGSIWQEKDGIIVTVFWYYRPEDVNLITAGLFCFNELMASQHCDEIAVACIDDKCQVFGFTQYCRYRANVEQAKAGVTSKSIVPLCSNQDLDGVTFSAFLKENDTSKELSRVNSEDDNDVYFCYRAFNHITGRVMRSTK